MIALQDILKQLCDEEVQLSEENSVVFAQATIAGKPIHILGVKEATFLGVEQALLLAEKVIEIIESKSTAPVLLMADVAGQQLAMRDEWLGMQQYFGHLLECLECLRKQGNRLISLVYNQAIGGGFIAFGLMGDTILALPNAALAVMWLEGISKVTKIELNELEELSKTFPVFAPGVNNFYKLGGLHDIVELAELAKKIADEMAKEDTIDNRAALGNERGGRKLALPIIHEVMNYL
ncbi:acetyl-CoA carboxylase subunit beta [Legionella massiliensis]|uniref:Acetyl-CoA carboxylase subunit beta n=1 Tax=Legionella massiliensis TaxID=1034943 RepID=A0A078KSX4_9GAMM|nr:biotin-independent malonate decarboxylase subunit gamma [Legionella massiliensis]CDZ77530.1 acetyl-CoA carboxylase subunit beta [Legionella massiliensis]CEE13268.1 Malonyl-S-ACP:biotin-protein carboxyltransferase MADD [Legionella massiliensis]